MQETKSLEEAGQKLIEKYKVPGAIVSLSKNGEKIYSSAMGYRNREEELLVTGDTAFGLASVTKSFTCAAIMHLQENGKLNVLDKVSTYLPEFRIKNKEKLDKIRIHHFMTHSSGLPPMSALEYAMKKPSEDNPSEYVHVGDNKEQPILHTYEDLMEYIADQNVELFADSGVQFSYSNEAYSLLGAIIERVSGQSYESYIYQYIVDPCGMKHTRFTFEEMEGHDNCTISYGKKGDKKEIEADKDWITSSSMQATGFLKSTANDMLQYAELYLNKGLVNGKRILSEESINEMLKPHMKVYQDQYYGYGLEIIPNYFGHTYIGHGGSLRAVSSRFGFILEKELAGIVLTNLIGVPAAKLLRNAFNIHLGEDMDANHVNYEEYDIDLAVLSSYTGKYKSDEGADITLEMKDGKLVFINEDGEYPTKFISKTELITKFEESEGMMEILVDEKEQPYALFCSLRVVPKVIE